MRETVNVIFRRLPHNPDLPLPSYATDSAAGMDLHAAVGGDEPTTIAPGSRALIPTGLAMALPTGYEAQVRPRSGLALRHGITVLNSPGTIDADYRGEVGVILFNCGDASFEVARGDRIAQLVVASVSAVQVVEAETLPDSRRGVAGFGSTGIDAGSGMEAEKSSLT